MTNHELNIHTLPDLSGWRVIEVWTIEEAAMIWAGLDPIDNQVDNLDKIKDLISERQYKKAWIARRAFVEAISQGTLPFVNAYEWNENDRDNWAQEVIFPNLPDANFTVTNRTRIAQAALLKWAKGKYPTLKEDLKKEQVIQHQPIIPQLQAPVIQGKTFDTIIQAVSGFPHEYPKYESDPPKLNNNVRPWIKETYQASDKDCHVIGKVIGENYQLKP